MTNRDIVERLRTHVEERGGPKIENGAWQMMLEAADEIERLRAENEHLKTLLDTIDKAIVWESHYPYLGRHFQELVEKTLGEHK